MKLVKSDNKVLYRRAVKVTVFDDSLHALIRNMCDTVKKEHAAGVAAPQLGVSKRVIVVNLGKYAFPMINPEVVYTSEETSVMLEGCLSFPGVWRNIERPKWAEFVFFNPNGKRLKIKPENPGVVRCILHEIDHLNGKVFTEYAEVPSYVD